MKWTDELVGKFAEMYRFSSGRTSMKQFKEMVESKDPHDVGWIKALKYDESDGSDREMDGWTEMEGESPRMPGSGELINCYDAKNDIYGHETYRGMGQLGFLSRWTHWRYPSPKTN